MNYTNLGTCGLKVSRIALGMMTFGTTQWRPWVRSEADARPIVRRAIELGINLFDTADLYSAGVSEEITGKLVREFAARDEVVQIHRFDPATPVEETMEALHDLVRAGKVRYLGASSSSNRRWLASG